MFYKLENSELISGNNVIIEGETYLYEIEASTYEYPIKGWYWFDTTEEANDFFGVE